jgi:glycosyltransferase involved in cell wall biosynthesis
MTPDIALSVLYVSPVLDHSGAERAQVGVLQADPGAIVVCPPDSRMAAFAQAAGARDAPAALPAPAPQRGAGRETAASVFRALVSVAELRQILRAQTGRTIVYCFSVRPAILATLASVGLRRAIVWNVTDFLPPQPLAATIRLLSRRRNVVVVTHSEAIRRDFAGRDRRLARKSRTISPGVDMERFPEVATDPGAPRAAIVGHVSPTKHTALALAITRKVLETHPTFRLSVIGRAQYRDEDFSYEREIHRTVAADSVLAKAVSFQGYADDVAGVLRSAGLLLHCRPDEPFGIVLTEAMAAGLPVVAPDGGGPKEIVDHGGPGCCIPSATRRRPPRMSSG